jgi:hypothetical protein
MFADETETRGAGAVIVDPSYRLRRQKAEMLALFGAAHAMFRLCSEMCFAWKVSSVSASP